MPNILLTYRCNLNCPYCFANEFVNRMDVDITTENFKTALDYIAKAPNTHVGLIGGEPLVHRNFEVLMDLVFAHPNVSDIMVYTNGLELNRLFPYFLRSNSKKRLKVLVNCNSPVVLGEQRFERLQQLLDEAFEQYRGIEHIKFGINLYDNEFDYQYIKRFLVRYDQRQVRISLTVPDFKCPGYEKSLDNFKHRKEYLLQFLCEMDEIGVLAYYDCNKPPVCIWTNEEWDWLQRYRAKYRTCSSNLVDDTARCAPVIDILPDLNVVRCLGMSDFDKVKLCDFDELEDLVGYYKTTIDAEGSRISGAPECKDCYERQTGRCMGGCLGYKHEMIERLNQIVENL